MEGAIYPPTLKTEKKYEKRKVFTGTFGIPFKPFLKNAEPTEACYMLWSLKRSNEEFEIPLDMQMILYLDFLQTENHSKMDLSMFILEMVQIRQNPIKNVKEFILNRNNGCP